MLIIAVGSSRLFCDASTYSFAASSRKRPYRNSRLSRSAARRSDLTCACWVIQEVANDVSPPIAVPARAAKAEMYAGSIWLLPLTAAIFEFAAYTKPRTTAAVRGACPCACRLRGGCEIMRCAPEFRGTGPAPSIGTGPSKDVFLLRYRHCSLLRRKGFRTASSGCPERAGRTTCIAHLDRPNACLVADSALRWGARAKPGCPSRSFR